MKKVRPVRPETKQELQRIITRTIKIRGNNCDLNFIDTSLIEDMSNLDFGPDFNGDISKWDVSGVMSMAWMFRDTRSFNSPLNEWDVSHVTDM